MFCYDLQAAGSAGAPPKKTSLFGRVLHGLFGGPAKRVHPAPKELPPKAQEGERTAGVIPLGHHQEPGGVEAFFHSPQVRRSDSGKRLFVEQPVNRVLGGRTMDTTDIHQFRSGPVPPGEIRESHGTVYPGGVYVGVEHREGQDPKMVSGGQVPTCQAWGKNQGSSRPSS